MKPLENETNFTAEECAALLADTVPLVMRTIRADMRQHSGDDLTVPQFRTLMFLRRHPGASLSEVADHIGLTLPSISKMIDRLEARGLLARLAAPNDRRRICLELTPLGQSTLKSASDASRAHLADALTVLTPDERAALVQAMRSLRSIFSAEPTTLDPDRLEMAASNPDLTAHLRAALDTFEEDSMDQKDNN